MKITTKNIVPRSPLEEESVLRISFSRYDCESSEFAEILSSTSLHRKPNFHHRKEWRTIALSKSPDCVKSAKRHTRATSAVKTRKHNR